MSIPTPIGIDALNNSIFINTLYSVINLGGLYEKTITEVPPPTDSPTFNIVNVLNEKLTFPVLLSSRNKKSIMGCQCDNCVSGMCEPADCNGACVYSRQEIFDRIIEYDRLKRRKRTGRKGAVRKKLTGKKNKKKKQTKNKPKRKSSRCRRGGGSSTIPETPGTLYNKYMTWYEKTFTYPLIEDPTLTDEGIYSPAMFAEDYTMYKKKNNHNGSNLPYIGRGTRKDRNKVMYHRDSQLKCSGKPRKFNWNTNDSYLAKGKKMTGFDSFHNFVNKCYHYDIPDLVIEVVDRQYVTYGERQATEIIKSMFDEIFESQFDLFGYFDDIDSEIAMKVTNYRRDITSQYDITKRMIEGSSDEVMYDAIQSLRSKYVYDDFYKVKHITTDKNVKIEGVSYKLKDVYALVEYINIMKKSKFVKDSPVNFLYNGLTDEDIKDITIEVLDKYIINLDSHSKIIFMDEHADYATDSILVIENQIITRRISKELSSPLNQLFMVLLLLSFITPTEGRVTGDQSISIYNRIKSVFLKNNSPDGELLKQQEVFRLALEETRKPNGDNDDDYHRLHKKHDANKQHDDAHKPESEREDWEKWAWDKYPQPQDGAEGGFYRTYWYVQVIERMKEQYYAMKLEEVNRQLDASAKKKRDAAWDLQKAQQQKMAEQKQYEELHPYLMGTYNIIYRMFAWVFSSYKKASMIILLVVYYLKKENVDDDSDDDAVDDESSSPRPIRRRVAKTRSRSSEETPSRS